MYRILRSLFSKRGRTCTGAKQEHYIQLYDNGGDRWSWRAHSISNGQVVFTPHEDFYSRSNAERSALRMQELYGIEVRGLAREFKGI